MSSTYIERTKQRRECARLIRAMTTNLDLKYGRGAYRIPIKVAKRLEEIVGQDFSDIMQDAGFYRDATGRSHGKPGIWRTGGRTQHAGESIRDWNPKTARFWAMLGAAMGHFAPISG
ncbi:hypothetical protein [Ruegeria sp. HKCCE3926]|uniref:hypothetical protein n=1 Tax=Ruegeria sp. HKCCE3926 TaxID=2794831 RepID=UPI001AE9D76B|nr:hypothetical protein [Ruegeria sp. HKCCE3926]